MPQPHIYKLQVREFHLDTFGHVNHAVYLQMCEDARWQMCFEGGITLEDIHKEQIGPIILDASVKYKKELKTRENIEIHTTFKKIRDTIFQIHHTIYKEDKTISAELVLHGAIWNMKERKLIAPTEKWKQIIVQD